MAAGKLPQDTADVLEGLDRNRLAKGSGELYDAILTRSPAEVCAELAKHPRHPVAELLGEWLRARGVEPPPPPSADEVLARLGIPDIEAHLQKKDAEIQKLRRELEDVRSKGSDALRAATGYSFTTVLLVGVAILGWLAALGVLPITPYVPPTLDELQKEQGDKPTITVESTGPGSGR